MNYGVLKAKHQVYLTFIQSAFPPFRAKIVQVQIHVQKS